MFNKEIFSQRLKFLRNDRRITLSLLGESIVSSKSTLSNLENGVKSPSIDMLIKLANYFNVSLDYLVGLTDNPHRES